MNNSLAPMQASLPSSVSYVDPAAVAAAEAAKARIQAAYIMAMQRPRSYDQSRIKILEACSRPAFAEKVEYSKPVGGGKPIVGPSIRFAELALREWGNISYENQVVYDDDLTRRINVVITDLETNTTFSASIQLAKTVERKNATGREVVSERINSYGDKVYIVKATEDEIMTKQSAAVSKSLRNEGLRLIPQDIIEEAIERARETVKRRDKADPDAARKKLADAFAGLRIMPADLEKYLGHPLGQTSPAELQDLRSIYQTIKDGEAKWSDYVSPPQGEESAAAAAARGKLQSLKGRIKGQMPTPDPEPDSLPAEREPGEEG
jgi:hypothetical protein